MKRAAVSRRSSFFIHTRISRGSLVVAQLCSRQMPACRPVIFTALSSFASSIERELALSCAARYKQHHPEKPAPKPRRLVGQARAADATRGIAQGRTPDWLIGGQPSRDATLGGPAQPKCKARGLPGTGMDCVEEGPQSCACVKSSA